MNNKNSQKLYPPMENHYTLSDSEFEKKFSSCQFDPVHFTHEAHLRLAYIHIDKYGLLQAERNIQSQLKKFVAFAGAKHKYNTTLTVAAIKAVHHFMCQSDTDSFTDFITKFPRLKNNFRELIAFHYSLDIYNSEKAKKEYLNPDFLPF